MDPVSAIANAIAVLGNGATNIVAMTSRKARFSERMTAADFQKRINTSDIILGGMFLALLVVIIAVAVNSYKK